MRLTRLFVAGLIAGLVSTGSAQAAASKLVFYQEPVGGSLGQPLSVQPIVEAQDADGMTDTSFNGSITIDISAATAVGGVRLLGTKTVKAEAGVAFFTDLQTTQPGLFTLTATSGSLTPATSAGFSTVMTISDVWAKSLPTAAADGIDPVAKLSGRAQIRSMAVNSNPGSPWRGTVYLPRRNNQGAAGEVGPGTVFYWKGDKILRSGGPDLAAPDGSFVSDPSVTDIAAGNFCWGIAVAEDDYVYVASLNAGKLLRYNPDGTNPVLVVASGFSTNPTSGAAVNLRQIFATGKGINTTIWYINELKNVEKWVATAVDGNDAPTSFAKTTLFTALDTGNQHHQLAVNTAQDTVYYALYGTGTFYSPQKYSIGGVRDTGFPIWTLLNGEGVALDSQGRVTYSAHAANKAVVALNPRNGSNIVDDGAGGIINIGHVMDATAFVYNFANHYMELGRYSDRHIVVFGNDGTATGGSALGIIDTHLPAPDPKNVLASNPGTGNSLEISWTLPRDAEVTGVNIYRSTTAGVLGSKINASVVTTSPYTDTGLTTGVKYYYTVRTVGVDPFDSTTYESATIDQVSETPVLLLPPDPPSNITATDTQQGGEILLSWVNPPLYANAIRIYRSTVAGELGALVKTVQPITLGAPDQYKDTGLTGNPYYYTVKAVNGKGEESSNTAQVSATPTDAVPPVFAGLTQATEIGFPGYRLVWAPATDNSLPITYRIYVGSSPDSINYSTPVGVTTGTTFDLKELTLGQDAYIVVRARDTYGREDANTAFKAVTPVRSIVDSDQNAGANFEFFNKQPDPNLPALEPSAIGDAKGGGAPDLVPGAFAAGQFFRNTMDKKGKWSFQLPITAAGRYTISLFFNPDANLNAPGCTYTVTLPNGTVLPPFVVDQTTDTDNQWNLLTTQDLTVGTLTIVGDATTSPETDVTRTFVSGAARALIELAPSNVPIYKAAAAPAIDGVITAAEWAGAPVITLGKAWQNLIPGKWFGSSDYTAYVQVKWDASALYLAASVTDNILSLPATPDNQIFFRDGLELFLGLDPNADPARTTYYVPGDFQILLSAQDTGGGVLVGQWYSSYATNIIGTTSNVAMKAVAGGYTLEAAIPWNELDGTTAPVENDVIGFCIVGDDNDLPTPDQQSAFSLTGIPQAWQNPQAWTKATLKGLPPAAVKGDINQDGLVTNADAELAAKVAAGLVPGNSPLVSIANGDMNADNKITLADVSAIQRKANGK